MCAYIFSILNFCYFVSPNFFCYFMRKEEECVDKIKIPRYHSECFTLYFINHNLSHILFFSLFSGKKKKSYFLVLRK